MPDDGNSSPKLPNPWKDFLGDIDAMLSEPLELHCIGGFVVCFFYGFSRPTADIDYYTAIPANLNLTEVAGEGSPLAKKYKIWLHSAAVTSLPEDYDTRLTDMFPDQFKNLKLLAPDPYDFILSKLERNGAKDRDDARYLFKAKNLNSQIHWERYKKELRPYLANEARHDTTLKLWVGIFEANQ